MSSASSTSCIYSLLFSWYVKLSINSLLNYYLFNIGHYLRLKFAPVQGFSGGGSFAGMGQQVESGWAVKE